MSKILYYPTSFEDAVKIVRQRKIFSPHDKEKIRIGEKNQIKILSEDVLKVKTLEALARNWPGADLQDLKRVELISPVDVIDPYCLAIAIRNPKGGVALGMRYPERISEGEGYEKAGSYYLKSPLLILDIVEVRFTKKAEAYLERMKKNLHSSVKYVNISRH